MSKGPYRESEEVTRLRQHLLQADIKEQQNLLKVFLTDVKRMVEDQASLHLPKTLDQAQVLKITRPQVFISYAWEAEGLRLNHLQLFLSLMYADFEQAGLTPWLDLHQMTGDIEKQMRTGVQESQYVLLIGTLCYAEKTKPDSVTNVYKELKFVQEEYANRVSSKNESADFLLPVMLEGDYKKTFPSVGQHLIRDGRSFLSWENKNFWRSFENYIKELTQFSPVGILPCLLGLNRRNDYRAYRDACLYQYKILQDLLMKKIESLKRKQNISLQLVPVKQISLQEIEYERKTDQIGKGSYGEVFRGIWQSQIVAVKELSGSLTVQAEKELYNEAAIMMYLAQMSQDPGLIVRLLGVAVEKPTYALVMEYLPCGTLFELLQAHSELPEDLMYQIAMDILHGLDLLHKKQILHRDLRSHNVLLHIWKGRLCAKLSDFGLSSVKSSVRSSTMKKIDSVGTLGWMAPELFRRGSKSTAASDIYSYGMVLWELITHAIPFSDAEKPELISQWVLSGDREKIPDPCPAVLGKIIPRCWEAKPEDRITLEEIQNELAEIAITHPTSTKTQLIVQELQKKQDEKLSVPLKSKKPLPEQKKSEEDEKIRLELAKWQTAESDRQLEIKRMQDKIAELELAAKRQHEQKINQPEQSASTTPEPELPQTPEQLKLQNQLIEACEQGDIKAMNTLLKQKAQPDKPNAEGKYPLESTVWGMNPEAVRRILTALEGKQYDLTWGKIVEYNETLYGEIWMVSEFKLITWGDWNKFIQKIKDSPFLREFHFKLAMEKWRQHDIDWKWENFKSVVEASSQHGATLTIAIPKVIPGVNHSIYNVEGFKVMVKETESGLLGFKTQIQQEIAKANRQRKSLSPASNNRQTLLPKPNTLSRLEKLKKQDQLIEFCKKGDEKAVRTCLMEGADAEIPGTNGENPIGAAIFGMCPGVLNVLSERIVSPKTWQEREADNMKKYGSVFLVSKPVPQSIQQFFGLLQKTELSPYIKELYFKHFKVLTDRHINSTDPNGIQNWTAYIGRLAVAKPKKIPHKLPVPQCRGGVLVKSELRLDDSVPKYYNGIKSNVQAAERELDALRETIKATIVKKEPSIAYQMS